MNFEIPLIGQVMTVSLQMSRERIGSALVIEPAKRNSHYQRYLPLVRRFFAQYGIESVNAGGDLLAEE